MTRRVTSLCGTFEVASCYGTASATIHLTLPAPTGLALTAATKVMDRAAMLELFRSAAASKITPQIG